MGRGRRPVIRGRGAAGQDERLKSELLKYVGRKGRGRGIEMLFDAKSLMLTGWRRGLGGEI